MSNALIIKAAALIGAGDIEGAEFALVSLVDTEGDNALVAVLDELPPKDLLAVIREYDSSKESVINLLVTPEQFARAVVMEKHYGDRTHRHLRGMINSVLFRDDAEPGEFIEAIAEIDGGTETLIDYLSEHDEAVVHFGAFGTFNPHHTEDGDEIEKSEASDRDWKELTWLLKHDHPRAFDNILPELKRRYQHRLRMEAELESQEQKRLEREEAADFTPSRAQEKPRPTTSIEDSAL